ncbi:DUF6153 family protein [Streptomyces leeuwenhoekii]|uniref:DUF6153 family protein n=1 Tax=Streptomyces leeuwenhoekii TaxID=1437453 RepID=UPI00227728CE|nr:DUF6153 family protein [Streptomyces leeuwenhoekii]
MGSEQHGRRPPAWRWRAVCVLGLLAGLLGMHGLAPRGGLPDHTHTSSAHVAPAGHPLASSAAAPLTPASAPGASVPASVSSGSADSLAASVPAVPSGRGPEPGPERSAPPSSPAAAAAHDGCGATDGDCGGGHVRHADTTCASGAVGGGPVLSALVADPVPPAVRAEGASSRVAEAPDGARAPPSLSELQLLRI